MPYCCEKQHRHLNIGRDRFLQSTMREELPGFLSGIDMADTTVIFPASLNRDKTCQVHIEGDSAAKVTHIITLTKQRQPLSPRHTSNAHQRIKREVSKIMGREIYFRALQRMIQKGPPVRTLLQQSACIQGKADRTRTPRDDTSNLRLVPAAR